MATPLRPKTLPTRVKTNTSGLRREQRKPNLPGPYIYVGDFDTLTPPVVTWQSPPWLNNFTWFGTSYFGFRHGLDGGTEFVGTLDLTAGAVSGDVAFRLPVPWRNVFHPRVFRIDVGTGAGPLGILRMDTTLGVTYGNVIIEWPVRSG